MLDHVFTDAISALRDAFEAAFLERQAFEEHFQVDVLLGDITWETSYGLPGEGQPPTGGRPRHLRLADVEPDRLPPLVRRRGARDAPRPSRWRSCSASSASPNSPRPSGCTPRLPESSPLIGDGRLERAGLTVEIAHPDPAEAASAGADSPELEYAVEITYEGLYELAEETLADGTSSLLDEHFGALGGWVASTLVRLGDLRFAFLPAEDGSSD